MIKTLASKITLKYHHENVLSSQQRWASLLSFFYELSSNFWYKHLEISAIEHMILSLSSVHRQKFIFDSSAYNVTYHNRYIQELFMSKVVCHLLTKPIIVLSNSAKKYSPQPWLHQVRQHLLIRQNFISLKQ